MHQPVDESGKTDDRALAAHYLVARAIKPRVDAEIIAHLESCNPGASVVAWRLRDPSRLVPPNADGVEGERAACDIEAFAARPGSLPPRDVLRVSGALHLAQAKDLLFAWVSSLAYAVVPGPGGIKLLHVSFLDGCMLPGGKRGQDEFDSRLAEATVRPEEARATLAAMRTKLADGQGLPDEIAAYLQALDVTVVA